MKTFHLVFFSSLLLFPLLFQSCEEDDGIPNNAFTYQGITYDIANVFYSPDDNTNETIVVLASSEISYNSTGKDFDGTGSSIALVFEHSSDELEEGVYFYSGGGDEIEEGAVSIGNAVGVGPDVDAGKATIENNGNRRTITVEFVLENSETVIGSFRGGWEEVDLDF